jgi:rRNA maturation RNase YbeY
MNSYFAGLYQQKGTRLPTYDDGLAWMYRQATAGAQICGEFPRAFRGPTRSRAATAIEQRSRLSSMSRVTSTGSSFSISSERRAFIEGTGKLENYSSASRNFYGARGVEIAWTAAGLLPELKTRPELWDGNVPEKLAAEPRVPIIDESPVIDGKRDATYVKLEGTNGEDIALLSDPRNLHIHVQSSKPEVTLSFQHAGPVSGEARIGRITLKMDGTMTVVNDKGARLLAASAFVAGETWSAELSIPYSVVPAQAQWINGVDHGRYLVTCNGGKAQTVYFLSSSTRVSATAREFGAGHDRLLARRLEKHGRHSERLEHTDRKGWSLGNQRRGQLRAPDQSDCALADLHRRKAGVDDHSRRLSKATAAPPRRCRERAQGARPRVSLHVQNRQRAVQLRREMAGSASRRSPSINAARISDDGRFALRKIPEINVVVVSDRRIAKLHQEFMGIAGATDVITFEHGDIVMSAGDRAAQCDELRTAVEAELALYTVHGLLHLNGFEDSAPKPAARMRKVQSRVLQECLAQLPMPRNPMNPLHLRWLIPIALGHAGRSCTASDAPPPIWRRSATF